MVFSPTFSHKCLLSLLTHYLLMYSLALPTSAPSMFVHVRACSLAQLCFRWKNLLHEAMNPTPPTFNMGGDIGYSNSNSSNGSNSSAAGGGGSSMSTANYEYALLITWSC